MELGPRDEGVWEVAVTHFILTADPGAAGRPSATSASFIYITNGRPRTINNCFLLIFRLKSL